MVGRTETTEETEGPLVIIVNGTAQAGKDTFTEAFLRGIKRNMYIPTCSASLSTVDFEKEVAANLFGWDGVKDEKGRQLLCDLKDAGTKYNNGPFRRIVSIIESLDASLSGTQLVVVVHSREPDEIEKFQCHFPNSYSVWVDREDLEPSNTQVYSDQVGKITDSPYDFQISNKNLAEFEASAEFLAEHILTVEGLADAFCEGQESLETFWEPEKELREPVACHP